MTEKTDELMKIFGQLFQHRGFVGAAITSTQSKEQRQEQNQRGPLRVLQLLADKGELTNTAIAEAFDIRPSSVSALVSRLEAVAMIERHSSPTDKRVMLISLTTAGRKLLHAQDEYTAATLAGLSAAEVEQLSTLLKKVLAALPAEDNSWAQGWNRGGKQAPWQGPTTPHNKPKTNGPEDFGGHNGWPFGFEQK
ncbi:MarR family winged helix-turn-helix transcriptional regulator [Loigolactobacillus jiayinensis]|uniref:MarR family winged helix-turn-helix transcriptional regulator n=1 Tax=Loigolactobacillus jiayinensis TaxID=2486016 RepID=A0ABW1RGB0_9LACO|nr:MarR family transcriptional regulator [Loigolactobacillus jiayinensis]